MIKNTSKKTICKFIEDACISSTNKELYICTINEQVAQRIKQYIPLSISNYSVIITEEYVRHVKNRHKKDLEFICLIPEIINLFDKVSKSIEPNRRTKKTEIFIVFEKKYDNDIVKLVKFRDLFNKSLVLKTIFRKD